MTRLSKLVLGCKFAFYSVAIEIDMAPMGPLACCCNTLCRSCKLMALSLLDVEDQRQMITDAENFVEVQHEYGLLCRSGRIVWIDFAQGDGIGQCRPVG